MGEWESCRIIAGPPRLECLYHTLFAEVAQYGARARKSRDAAGEPRRARRKSKRMRARETGRLTRAGRAMKRALRDGSAHRGEHRARGGELIRAVGDERGFAFR